MKTIKTLTLTQEQTETFKQILGVFEHSSVSVVEYQPDDGPEARETVQQLEAEHGVTSLSVVEVNKNFYYIINTAASGYMVFDN